jgi:hypothetical protein
VRLWRGVERERNGSNCFNSCTFFSWALLAIFGLCVYLNKIYIERLADSYYSPASTFKGACPLSEKSFLSAVGSTVKVMPWPSLAALLASSTLGEGNRDRDRMELRANHLFCRLRRLNPELDSETGPSESLFSLLSSDSSTYSGRTAFSTLLTIVLRLVPSKYTRYSPDKPNHY